MNALRHPLLTAKIEPVIRHIWEMVQYRSKLPSHMGFPVVPKLMVLNDLEPHIGGYFALFHRNRQFGAVARSLKLDPYCLGLKYSPKESSFGIV